MRNYGLDLMRTIAIGGVLLSHGISVFISNHLSQFWNAFAGWLGFIGVEMFFALSGFLVGGIVIKSLEKLDNYSTIKHFWIMRWYRTLPNYFFYLLLHAFLITGMDGTFDFLVQHVRYLFFFQSFAWHHPPFFPEAWSLAVEEWFYFLMPISIWTLMRLKSSAKSSLFVTIAVLTFAPILLRLGVAFFRPDLGIELQRKAVLLRLDAIMYGVAAAYVFHRHNAIFTNRKLPFFYIGIFFLISIFLYQFLGFAGDLNRDIPFKVVVLSLAPLGCAFLIPFIYQIKSVPVNLFAKSVNFIAKISYSLYLCNLIVLSFVHKHLSLRDPSTLEGTILVFLVFLLLCTFMASLTYKCIEKPILDYRDRKYSNP